MILGKTLLFICCITMASACNDDYKQNGFSTNQLIGKNPPQLYGTNFKLQKKAYNAFLKMKNAALKDSVKIKVVSSFRSYSDQNRIWQSKYTRYTKSGLTPQQAITKIIEYSTIPGTSRHHWGTDVDIVDAAVKAPSDAVLQAQFFNKGQAYAKLKKWLDNNANTFGFYLVYTQDPNRKGFKYEPWHYSYAPLSKPMLKAYLKLDLNKILETNKLLGNKYLTPKFLKNYKESHILGINNYLKPTTK